VGHCLEHALRGRGIGHRVALAVGEVVLEREFFFAGALEASCKAADHVHADLLDRTDAVTDRLSPSSGKF
jgi:hypothetical protein